MQENVTVSNTSPAPSSSNNMLPIILGVVVIAGLAIAGYVFAQGQRSRLFVSPMVSPSPVMETAETASPIATPMVATASPTASASPATKKMESTDDVKIVAVEAGSFYYKPNEIRVKKGQKVRIEMTSVSMMHDFVIDELNVRMPIVQNGNKGTVEFTADKVGTFEYYCSVMQHRKMGQVGKLIVE